MARRVRTHDWSLTPLGPKESWPQSLRIAVGICLNSRFPMFVWWGPDLINIYNDAYVPMLGKRHPEALGRPARSAWGDIWAVVGPQAEAVMTRGEATWNERVMLLMERHGYREETYFTWSYSPIPDERGGIGGLFCAVTEETQRVLAERERDRLTGQKQLALDAARMGWWHYDPLTKLATWDERYAEIFGVTGHERPNEEILKRLHPDDLPRVRAAVEAALDPKDPRPYSTEYRVVRDDGSVRWVEAHGTASFEGEGDARRATSFVGTVADVTDRKRAEEQPRTVLESISDAFYAVDADFRFTYINRKAEELWGRRREDLIGRHYWTEFPQAVGSESHRMHLAVMAERKPVWYETVSPVIGRWIDVSIYPEAGGGLSCYFRDVSGRKKAEQSLRESEQSLRIAQNAARVGTWEFDIRTGEAVWSEGIWRLLGLAPGAEQPSFDRWMAHVHPDDRARVAGEFSQVLARGATEFYLEFRLVRCDRGVIWVASKGQVIADGSGKPARALGANYDITERRVAEEAVRRHERQLQLITDTAPAYIAYCAADGRFRFVNRNYAARFGTRPEDVVGKHLSEVLGERAYESLRPYVEQVLAGKEVEFEIEVPYSTLGRRWMQCRYAPEVDESGAVRGWVSVILDVTARKQADEALREAKEAAEAASRAKDEFLAVLSHELRTPLTPVLLTVSLMESHPALPEDLRQDVATIRRNVELESRLISDLLDLTRVTRGKLQLDLHDVDLHLIVRSAVDICQREASAKLTLDLAAARHTVRGDSTRLQQIFWNLVNNAIKFTAPEGAITVRSSNPADGRVRVEVTDTGAGIDPAVLPKLFKAFEQGEVRAIRQQAGLGLGLAISRRLAEAHGGTITASSPGRGRGATFAVELPVVEPFQPASAAPRETPAPAAGRPLSVLLVEDHGPTLDLLARLLRRMGHRVTGATSVAAAIAAAGQDGFDLIISDLGLPDGSGLDVMRQLRDRYAGRAIAVTGYGMESDIAATRDAGFTEHLTKPVDLTALQAAIRRVTPG